MKIALSLFGAILICLSCVFFGEKQKIDDEYFRIHVISNSNSAQDEKTKYLVKDAIVEFLIPILADVKTEKEAERTIEENIKKICEVANDVLALEGAGYFAKAFVEREKMPTRSYGELTLSEGVYNCLRIELGQAQGENWWCVVFPAVCFLNTKNSDNIVYISKIWEIIDNINQKQGG